MKTFRLWVLFIVFTNAKAIAQNNSSENHFFDFKKIYSFCLDADINSALKILKDNGNNKLNLSEATFKTEFESRFVYSTDKSDFLEKRNSSINKLLNLYHNYWRLALLNKDKNYNTLLLGNLTQFLASTYKPAAGLTQNEDSLDVYIKKYIEAFGMHTAGFGKTGKLYDLLVWKSEKDTVYEFKINGETTTSRVILMNDFITLGWEEYATLDKYYPGGWATDKALFCVAKAYDLNSEKFLISYLAHESRHFADYKLFPKLKSADLEYRAKLTELGMANTSLYKLIEFFINNANYESENGHSVANYCVIRDLSKALFKNDFEKDLNAWQKLDTSIINSTALKILNENTQALKLKGGDVEKYIKN